LFLIFSSTVHIIENSCIAYDVAGKLWEFGIFNIGNAVIEH
jgi:hypothetical protein